MENVLERTSALDPVWNRPSEQVVCQIPMEKEIMYVFTISVIVNHYYFLSQTTGWLTVEIIHACLHLNLSVLL